MQIDVQFDALDSNGEAFLSWTPRKLTLRLVDAQGANPATVTVQSSGQVPLEISEQREGVPSSQLNLDLPQDGSLVELWISGQFRNTSTRGEASTRYGDAAFAVSDTATGSPLWLQEAMVRIRKNADELTPDERDRFLQAMATLNDGGLGRFTDFREMHVSSASIEAHGDVGFLPWHRAYLLDLERELQAIDSSVALPYWRFDKPAPNLFSHNFIGLPDSIRRVQFSFDNPLNSWRTDGQLGVVRGMSFDRQARPDVVISEDETLALGGFGVNTQYRRFIPQMEFNPHGMAHTRFSGFVSNIGSAARDPLFFLLHCNVDRLWAKWQWLNKLTSSQNNRAYAPSFNNRIGHRLGDSMWPWNQDMNPPRPGFAPGGGLAESDITSHPGSSPLIDDMIDFQGINGDEVLVFDYDDVPVEFSSSPGIV